MFKVEITNYESIEHLELIIEGFTTIIGRNGLGKSAVLRAINAALTNQPGTQCIRWGEKYCEVHIVAETIDLLWHKEEGNNYYIINSKKYEKIGKEPPPQVLKDAGYGVLRIGQDEKINLSYANQFHPLFLVDKQDSKGVDLITAVYGLDRLYKAADLCNKAQKANSDTLRLRAKDLELLEADLKKLDGLDAIIEAVKALEEYKKVIEKDELKIQHLQEQKKKLYDLHASYKRLSIVSSVAVPDMDVLRGSIQTYVKTKGLQDNYVKLTQSTARLNMVSSIEIPPVEGIKEAAKKVSDLRKTLVTYNTLLAYEKKAVLLKGLAIPTVPEGYDKIQRLKEWQSQITSIKQSYAISTKELEACVKELDKTKEDLKEYKVCPACGSSLEGKI